MALQLFVGQFNLRGAINKYASRFNLLELRAEPERLPRESVLRRWADEVSDRFAFSVLLGPQHAQSSGDPSSMLSRAILAAKCLEAKWIVIQTEPMWGPSQKTKQRLAELFERLSESGCRVGWEPHGVWQDEEALAFARELGMHFVRDIGRGDPLGEDVVYSRMPGLGILSRMSLGAMERVARNLGNASEAYLVVGGDGAGKLQQLLPALVAGQEHGMTRVGGEESSVETFGGFTSQRLAADAEAFEALDDDEFDEANEEEELEGEEDEDDADEDVEDDEDDEEPMPTGDDAEGTTLASKGAQDKRKRDASGKPRKGTGRR
jgi:uncharacterized protein YecE (DUF72 family)